MTKHQKELPCNRICCFWCIMNEPDPFTRRSKLALCFRHLCHGKLDDDLIIALLRDLWSSALSEPDSTELPSLGIFDCMAQLMNKCIRDRRWISRGNNVVIAYYAAHIIGSYTMNKAELAEMAVESGIIPPLMELLRGGKMSWVEQRVAVRALGHIASHEKTFEAIGVYEEEIVNLAMDISSTCFKTTYHQFLRLKAEKRVQYHRDLLMRRRYGSDLEMENRKAEEWASQLQCWSLYLINCFAVRKTSTSISLICTRKGFLEELCGVWGPAFRETNSFSGVCLIRSVCHTSNGRKSVANSKAVIESLCNLCRSSDEGKEKAMDSILLLLRDPKTRPEVIDLVAHFMVDLVELKTMKRGARTNVGDCLTGLLLQDFRKDKMSGKNALQEVWKIKVQRRRKDDMLSEEELREKKIMVEMLKHDGNRKFWSGNAGEAVECYSKALDLCPMKMKRERVVLYSNRAQCHLLLAEAELAVSDTTRALCLSGDHLKSLWRRSQAYDMLGMARHSLMDSFTFINLRTKSNTRRQEKVPFYAVRMLKKQISATNPWLPRTSLNQTPHNLT